MKIELLKKETVDVKYFEIEAGVRYWEDATVNGSLDHNGDLIPCRKGDYWCPFIDIDKGKILNWEKGKTAKIHYKVCDDGNYKLLDENKKIILNNDGYVPDALAPNDESFGDYIILQIDRNGLIKDWDPNFEDLIKREFIFS
ncbi:hypothetical protein [Winogradskyella sp.]|uniref:hypothetical protein n=1 Tax=Winogradskyella sp. TaxID=1883156 RepID=UPI002615E152|nr:hypothetical protein [Winogradskyella sp.]